MFFIWICYNDSSIWYYKILIFLENNKIKYKRNNLFNVKVNEVLWYEYKYERIVE